jgi:hypothetical protein
LPTSSGGENRHSHPLSQFRVRSQQL